MKEPTIVFVVGPWFWSIWDEDAIFVGAMAEESTWQNTVGRPFWKNSNNEYRQSGVSRNGRRSKVYRK